MPSRRLSLMLLMAVAIGGGLLIYRTTDQKTFHFKNEPNKLSLEPGLAVESPPKKELEPLEGSLTENHGFVFGSLIQKQSEILKSDKRFSNSEQPHVAASRKRFRRHSRKKRNVAKGSDGWFFNLNITRPRRTTSMSPDVKTDPRFGISIHVEGGDDSDDVREAWDHVETLVHNLFGGSYEELGKSGHEVIIDLSGLPNDAQTDLKAKEHLEEILPPKGKEPKFFLGLLGVGGNREKPTTEKVKNVIMEVSSSKTPSTSQSEINHVIEVLPSPTEVSLLEVNPNIADSVQPIGVESTVTPIDEHLETLPGKNGISTTPQSKFSNGLTVFPHVEYVETDPALEFKEESSSETKKDDSDGLLNMFGQTSTVENETPKLTPPGVPLTGTIDLEDNFNDPGLSSGTSVSTESFFSVGVPVSPEQLREFCVNLLEKIQISPRSVQQELNSESSGNSTSTVEETVGTNLTSTTPKPENSGFFVKLLNRIVGRNAAKTPETTSASKRPKTEQEKSFFNKLVWNSGRARSIGSELDNFDVENMNVTEFEDFNVTVSDCEVFFQDWLNMDQDSTTPNPFSVTSLEVDETLHREVITESNEIEIQTKNSFEDNVESSMLEISSGNVSSGITESNVSENSFDDHGKSSLLEDPVGDSSGGITQKSLSETTTVEVIQNPNVMDITSDQQITSELEEKDARMFGLFDGFDAGSGGREIPVDVSNDLTENSLATVSERGLSNPDIKEKKSETEEISSDALEVTTESGGRRFIGFLNLGSGERQLGEESEYTDDYLFTVASKTGMNKHSSETATNDAHGNSYDERLPMSPSDLPQRFDQISSTEMTSDQTEDDNLHRRFMGFLNIGSGDGRNLPDSDDIFLPECVTCAVDNRTGEVKCSECTQEEVAERRLETSTMTSDGLFGEEESDPSKRFFLSGNRESTEEIVMKDHDDSNATTTTLPLLAPRESRALDHAAWDDSDLDSNEFVEAAHKEPSPLRGRRGRSEDLEEPFMAKVVTSPDFVVGVHPISLEIYRDVKPPSNPEPPKTFYNESFIELYVTGESTSSSEKTSSSQSTSSSEQTSSSQSTSSSEGETTDNADFTTLSMDGQRLSKFNRCNDDDDCSSVLNEMCVEQEGQYVCGCGYEFVRFPTTRICSRRVVLEMTIRIPLEKYHSNMNVTSSKEFGITKKNFIESVNILLKSVKLLQDALLGIEVTRFEAGSLLVHANLVFAKPAEMTSVNMVMKLLDMFGYGVKDNDFLEKAPLKMQSSEIMNIFVAGDVCDRQGNFRCHKDAKCIPDRKGGFTCKCKSGYIDLNLNGAPGRECEACPVEFCSGNGICKISNEGMKYCICTGWNIGVNCAIPGTVVIAGVAGLNAILVVIIVLVVCFYRRRKSRSCQYNGGEGGFSSTPASAVPSRLRGAVPMTELGQSVGTSRYASRSTPLQPQCPDIRIISPSNVGSEQSSVFDSTFDRSCEQDDSRDKV